MFAKHLIQLTRVSIHLDLLQDELHVDTLN